MNNSKNFFPKKDNDNHPTNVIKINAIIDNGRTHPIQNDTNMTVKGTLGKIKINVSFIFEDDATNLFRAYPAFDRHNKQVASFEAFYYVCALYRKKQNLA